MRFHHSFLRLAVLLVLSASVAATQPALARDNKIEKAIYEDFRRDGGICVCVELAHSAASTASLMTRCAAYARAQDECLAGLPDGSYELRYRFRYSPTVAIQIRELTAFAALERASVVKRVMRDTMGKASTQQSSQVIEAPAAHALGITGAGRVVAVLDTGIESTHDDFDGAVIHEWHFLDQGIDKGAGAEDNRGHGTLVSGIIASRGFVAGRGMAPGVEIIAIKVINDFGEGYFIDWAKGVEHVVDLHLADNGIKVDAINMSLQSHALFSTACDDAQPALAMASQAATEVGITVIACAGNGPANGDPSYTAISSPGCLSATVAIASVPDDDPDHLSDFTNRNALVDIVAPGELIISSGLRNRTDAGRGCSFAAPHAAAIVCLIRQADPALSAHVVAGILQLTGTSVFDRYTQLRFPLVNARRAVEVSLGPDCNGNGVGDFIDVVVTGEAPDCNGNGVPDVCDIADGTALDEDGNGISDDCSEDNPFNRGDASVDGIIHLGDALTILNFLFDSGDPLRCHDAADANNDGRLDIADGIFVLAYLFGTHNVIPPDPGPPGTPCGFDSEDFGTPGNLGCHDYQACGSEP